MMRGSRLEMEPRPPRSEMDRGPSLFRWRLRDPGPGSFDGLGRGITTRLRDWAAAICAIGWLVGMALSMPCEASAQTLSVAETENFVRQTYYEGMSEDKAERIGPEGAGRLMEMLADPAEAKHHAQILLALGLCGEEGALEAIRDWAAAPREGELDRATFKAWQALPFALGHLARHDTRALDDLEGQLTADAPNWRFRHHRGARLHSMARKAAVTSMAETGLPAARQALERAEQMSSDVEFEAHLRGARALHRRRAQEGRR